MTSMGAGMPYGLQSMLKEGYKVGFFVGLLRYLSGRFIGVDSRGRRGTEHMRMNHGCNDR